MLIVGIVQQYIGVIIGVVVIVVFLSGLGYWMSHSKRFMKQSGSEKSLDEILGHAVSDGSQVVEQAAAPSLAPFVSDESVSSSAEIVESTTAVVSNSMSTSDSVVAVPVSSAENIEVAQTSDSALPVESMGSVAAVSSLAEEAPMTLGPTRSARSGKATKKAKKPTLSKEEKKLRKQHEKLAKHREPEDKIWGIVASVAGLAGIVLAFVQVIPRAALFLGVFALIWAIAALIANGRRTKWFALLGLLLAFISVALWIVIGY